MRFAWWAITVTAAVAIVAAPKAASDRTLWVWDAAPLLHDTRARGAFFDFCRARGITIAWIQVSVRSGALDAAPDWQRLLADAHAAGLRVHALDGAPDYVLRHNHGTVIEIVDAIARFNTQAPATSRFDGVHLDNEPYLLPEWHDPAARERLLADYMELNEIIEKKTNGAGLEFGVDIPFWWQSRDSETGDAVGAVEFRGVRKAASYHLLDLVDNVGIMDYRNVAEGADGLIAHATDLLRYANTAQTRVFIGVETALEPPVPYWFLTGVPRQSFRQAIAKSRTLVARRDLRIVHDREHVHLGVPASDRDARPRLIELGKAFGVVPTTSAGMVASARRALLEEGEWRDPAVDPIVDDDGRAFGGIRAIRTMPPKTTFAGRSNAEMDRELTTAERAFASFKSYAGIAIHHYESYRSRFDGGPSGGKQ